MTKDNQRVMITKRLLKEALFRILEKKPLDKISVTELCREAGINRATFYRHYNLPRDVMVDTGVELFKRMQESLRTTKSMLDFEQYIEEMCAYLYEHRNIVRTMIRFSDVEIERCFKEIYQHALNERGGIPELKSFDRDSTQLIAAYLGGGGYFMLRQWLTEDIDKTPKEVASLLFQLVCRAENKNG